MDAHPSDSDTFLYLTKIDCRDRRPLLEVRLTADSPLYSRFPFLRLIFEERRLIHELDYGEESRALDAIFGLEECAPERYLVRIEGHGIARRVPYFLHTNYELPLMLDGRKPIARFSDEAGSFVLEDARSSFAPFVASGQILTSEDLSDLVLPDGRPFRMLDLYYHLPGEEWRLALLRQIQSLIRQGFWRPECEEIEGILLGYSTAENAWWKDRKTHLKGT